MLTKSVLLLQKKYFCITAIKCEHIDVSLLHQIFFQETTKAI